MRELKYKYYITDSLKAISESISDRFGGPRISTRFFDVLHPAEEDERTADEIVDDVIGKIGFGGVGN